MQGVTIALATKNSNTFDECLDTIIRNTDYPTYEVLVLNDGDDVNWVRDGADIREIRGNDVTIHQKNKLAIQAAKYDFIVFLLDDMFPTKGWLTTAMSGFEKHFPTGFGVICFNDTIWKEGEKACIVLSNKKTIDKYFNGELYDTRFIHYRADVLLAEQARQWGIYYHCKDAVIEHRHLGAAEDKKVFEEDMKTYLKIKESALRKNIQNQPIQSHAIKRRKRG